MAGASGEEDRPLLGLEHFDPKVPPRAEGVKRREVLHARAAAVRPGWRNPQWLPTGSRMQNRWRAAASSSARTTAKFVLPIPFPPYTTSVCVTASGTGLYAKIAHALAA